MQRSVDRILTTHTGSLPRPEAVEQAMFAKLDGESVDASALDRAIAAGVREVVDRQVEAGVDIICDGEIGKPSYATYVGDRLAGFGGESTPIVVGDIADYPDTAEVLISDPGFSHMQRPACIGPVSIKNPDAANRDIALLTEAVAGSGRDAFMTAVSPATITMFFENQYYPTLEEYLGALSDAMRPEYRAIVDAGLTLQIDCPDIGCGHVLYHDKREDEVLSLIPQHIEALNHALDGIPSDRVRMHVCWGNYQGPHHRDIDLRKIVGEILKVRADGILVEGANPRHEHEWAVWDEVALPEDKVLVPGVVDTTNNYIEHPELIAQRLERYASVVGRERVIAGSDCGFATLVGMRATAPSIAWRKLEAMAEGARIASARLWP
jgi:5-methyltetrahydropteroyltriglutamate--homocysteine methyltransferase